jgi:Protein of unknown function (DUF559)
LVFHRSALSTGGSPRARRAAVDSAPSTPVTSAQRYRDLRSVGLSESQVRWLVEDGRLVRPFHDVYLDPATAVDDTARLRALFVRLPAGSAACRQTAAHLQGFGEFAPLPRGVHVVLPPGVARPRFAGLRTHEAILPFEPVLAGGIPCTPAARTAVDLARTHRRMDALPVLDGALRSGCAIEHLEAEVALHRRLRGVCQARQLLRLADAGAQCRQESQLRLIAIDGGLPRPTAQLQVVDDFGFVRFVLDLAWERYRLAAEYDGRSHVDHDRMRHDRDRHNWLSARGWRMRYFTDVDLYRRPSHVVSVLRAALR